MTDTSTATMSAQLNGFTLEDDGGNFADTLSVNGNGITLNGIAGDVGIINYYNDRTTRDNTPLTAARTIVRVSSTVAHTVNMWNLRYNSLGSANDRGIGLITPNPIVNMWNFLIKGFKGASCGGIVVIDIHADSRIESGVVDDCVYGIINSNKASKIRNVGLFNHTTSNYLQNGSSLSVNCATDKASVGAATNTAPQNNVVLANEFESVDITDTTVGYKVKAGGALATNGAAVEIAGNTSGIYGNARPASDGTISIGASQYLVPAASGGGGSESGFRPAARPAYRKGYRGAYR